MRAIRLSLSCALATLACAATAEAAVPHVVGPGETLWSIAATHNFTTRALAAANGLPEDAHVVLGSTLQIPTVAEASAAMARAGMVPAPTPGAAPTAAAPTPTAAAPTGGPAPLGAYTVRPGDTLTALAARARVPVGQVAYMNGLDPAAPLLAGTAIKLPTGAPVPASPPAAPPAVVPSAAPYPTPARTNAAEVGQIAAAHGVPSSLAAAVGWQESGFSNGMVSSANARGVMQILPGTWDWIQQHLTTERLDPSSARDNVHAGVMYLGRLLQESGGDPAMAAAGYYQGMASVRRIGMLPETQRYVANVLALRARFGGP